ncbi:enoyl-CoA hydratase/isomerase family protein [Streptomyces sp. NPDC003710]
MPHLIYSIDDGLATLVLTNPPQNRIDPQMATELAEALEAIGHSDARAVLVRSEGPDFSFGGDIVDWPDADVRRARAAEWALTSERVPARVMAEAGVVNRVISDDALPAEATAFARKAAKGPTRAYAAHKSLLRAWAVGGVSAADEGVARRPKYAEGPARLPNRPTDRTQRGKPT